MTRRLAERPRRRLWRMRPALHRPEQGHELALVALRPPLHGDPGAGQRADQRALQALAEENALLARELGRVQARSTRWREDCIARTGQLEAQLMRARADGIAKETRLAALRDALESLEDRARAWLTQDDLLHRLGDLRARNRALEARLADAPPASATPGCRVLCVGGRPRQVPVYRELVERRGGSLAHIDGATPACLPALRQALAECDLVVLQPGFVCQAACLAVTLACGAGGLRCVRLDKTCALAFVAGFEQTLSRC